MVYNVYSDYALYRDAGEFLIYAACSPSAYRQVIEVIRQEVELLALEPISEAELKRIKRSSKGQSGFSIRKYHEPHGKTCQR